MLLIALMVSFCVSASDTTTKIQTGPFNITFDIGKPCDDVRYYTPEHTETIYGLNYTEYVMNACGIIIDLKRYDTEINSALDHELYGLAVKSDLISMGADKDAILTFDRLIDGKPGAVGSGYVPKDDMTSYRAGFHASNKTVCIIWVWENETKMVSTLKTIHITETT